MWKYIVKRILWGIVTVYGVATLTFVLMRIVPGDPAMIALTDVRESRAPSPEVLEAMRKRLGLDKPLHIQYGEWLWDSLRLDFGDSLWSKQPVIKEYARRLPVSVNVAVLAGLLTIVIAVPLGVISAVKQDTPLDYAARVFAIAGLSMPSFWVGLLLIIVFLNVFHWMPSIDYVPIWKDPVHVMTQQIWPAIAVAFGFIGLVARMTRSSVLEVMREDYIRTARAKGLREVVVLSRHALRNALLPVLTIFGLFIGFAMGGLVVVELVFNLPGLGRYLIQAVNNRDYTVIQATLFGTALFVTVANLLVDLAYGWLDPRVRYE